MIISKGTPKGHVLKLGEGCGSKRCNHKHHCCSHKAGFLAEEDMQNLSKHLGITEEELKTKFLEEQQLFNKTVYRPKSVSNGKPYGPCVFLDSENGCKVHEAKPLQCRLFTCEPYGYELTQWFYLNHVLDPDDPQSVREYAEWLQHNAPIPGGHLHEIVPDEEKLKKILSYEYFRKE